MEKELSKETLKILEALQQNEINEAQIYATIAGFIKNEKDKETLYRIEFPAKELGIIPGKPFRFNIQLNDNDGRCRVGFHAIAEVRDDGKNDTGFPEITFNNF